MRADLLAALLAFNSGVLLTLLLRTGWRQHFGAAATYRLWILGPIFALSTWLPAGGAELAPIRQALLQAAPDVAAIAAHPVEPGFDWLLLAWLAGALATALYFGLARWRLAAQWRNAPIEHDPRCPAVVVVRADFGPALVGIWRPLLILPHDFETRFDPGQQALVLAHESAHATAGDLWMRTLALLMVIAQWWNPLAWWSLFKLIEDQELACDARVMKTHPTALSTYAKALSIGAFDPQRSTVLVCSMHQSHPLLRRIAMLNRKAPSAFQSRLGAILTVACLLGVTVIGWASNTDAPMSLAQREKPDFFVDLSLEVDSQLPVVSGVGNQAGKPITLHAQTLDGKVDLSVVISETKTPDLVMLALVVSRDGTEIAHPSIAVKLDEPGKIEIGEQGPHGFSGIRFGATVHRWGERVDVPPTTKLAPDLAREVAAQAGLTLEGIELLSSGEMQANFNGIPAQSVLELIAHSNKLKLTRVGNHLTFVEP